MSNQKFFTKDKMLGKKQKNIDNQPYLVTCIHQPPFMPWLGIIESMLVCDIFVVYDDVQYEIAGWQNRNKLKSANGAIWVTIPIKNKFGQPIREVEISEQYSASKLLRLIETNYSGAIFFRPYYEEISEILLNAPNKLIDLNMGILKFLKRTLNTKCQFVNSSELNIDYKDKSEKILNVCLSTKTNVFYSGSGTQNYIDIDYFYGHNITLVWHKYENRHEIYPQKYMKIGFIPFMGCFDMLFNCGAEDMRRRLLNSGKQKLLEYNIKL